MDHSQPPIGLSLPATEVRGDRVLARAPAKLNLALCVGPLRADGFHPLDSVVTKIAWYDELEFTLRDDDQVTLACDDSSIGPVAENLVVRAAAAIRPPGAGVDIVLRKHIPAGAGLGGGSADAAMTLRVLNAMWDGWATDESLAGAAAALGSDVPLTLGPPTMRMRGRGEILDPLEIRPFFAVVITPPVHTPTGEVYAAFDAMDPTELSAPDIASFAARPPSEWGDALTNDLYAPACRVRPQIAAWVAQAAEATGEAVYMTGSGSALFILADDADAAVTMWRTLPADLADVSRIVAQNSW